MFQCMWNSIESHTLLPSGSFCFPLPHLKSCKHLLEIILSQIAPDSSLPPCGNMFNFYIVLLLHFHPQNSTYGCVDWMKCHQHGVLVSRLFLSCYSRPATSCRAGLSCLLAAAPEVIPLPQFHSILVTRPTVIYNLRGSEPRAPKKNLTKSFHSGLTADGCSVNSLRGATQTKQSTPSTQSQFWTNSTDLMYLI